MRAYLKISKMGNKNVIIIPQYLMDNAELSLGDSLIFNLQDNNLMITKHDPPLIDNKNEDINGNIFSKILKEEELILAK